MGEYPAVTQIGRCAGRSKERRRPAIRPDKTKIEIRALEGAPDRNIKKKNKEICVADPAFESSLGCIG